MNTTGHILRLPTTTPIQRALTEVTKPSKLNRGKPRNTWFRTIQTDLKQETTETNPKSFLQSIKTLASDRDAWRGVTRSAMSRAEAPQIKLA